MSLPQFTPLQHAETFIIRTYEIDHHKRATLPAMVRLMHEAAMQNVLKLRLSVWDLEAQHISWVLMRKSMHFERLPTLGERITVLTHPAGFERLFTYRDYRVFDEANRQIAWSSSTWLLMNTEQRRMTRIPDDILGYNEQMPDPEECLPRPSRKLPKLTAVERERRYEVNFFDLDFNNHLNNTLYIKWMLEALPDEVLESGRLRQLSIEYRAECRWKERVVAETQHAGDSGAYLHRLRLADGSKELAAARSVWA